TAFIVETLSQSLNGVRDKAIRLFDRTPRLVDEAGLNIIPPAPELANNVGFEQGGVARPGHVRRTAALARALHFALLHLYLRLRVADGVDRLRIGCVDPIGTRALKFVALCHGLTSRLSRITRSSGRSAR